HFGGGSMSALDRAAGQAPGLLSAPSVHLTLVLRADFHVIVVIIAVVMEVGQVVLGCSERAQWLDAVQHQNLL
ncbi:hypothetical protein NE477_25850, partial [Blautia marasmi]|uniref:hypothetical protein n=1 Tax=Blautia marasmi TaxID=1917868 RepID=UPI00210D4519